MKKIKVGKTCQFGGHTYSIKFDPGLQDDLDFGTVNSRTQEILINPVRPDSQKFEALIHEYLHISSHVFYHGEEEIMEKMIASLSEGMSQVRIGMGLELDWTEIKNK